MQLYSITQGKKQKQTNKQTKTQNIKKQQQKAKQNKTKQTNNWAVGEEIYKDIPCCLKKNFINKIKYIFNNIHVHAASCIVLCRGNIR